MVLPAAFSGRPCIAYAWVFQHRMAHGPYCQVGPPISTTLGMSLEELVGTQSKPGKRGPAPKLQQQLEQVSRLPRAKQQFVMQMLDTVLQQQGG